MLALTPLSASPGKSVNVTGDSVLPGTPVEIRWNSAQGQPVASTTADDSGSFSVAATVPEVAPGVYYIVASAGAAGQPAPQIARIAFEVTGAAPVPGVQASAPNVRPGAGSSQLWNGFASAGSSVSNATGQNLTTNATGPGAAAGFGLLAAGFIGLVAGAALIARRKSRAFI